MARTDSEDQGRQGPGDWKEHDLLWIIEQRSSRIGEDCRQIAFRSSSHYDGWSGYHWLASPFHFSLFAPALRLDYVTQRGLQHQH